MSLCNEGGSLDAGVMPGYWPRPLHNTTARIAPFEKWLLACHWVLMETKCLTSVWVNLDLKNQQGRKDPTSLTCQKEMLHSTKQLAWPWSPCLHFAYKVAVTTQGVISCPTPPPEKKAATCVGPPIHSGDPLLSGSRWASAFVQPQCQH